MSRRTFVKVAAGAAAIAGVALAVPIKLRLTSKDNASPLNYKGKVKPTDRLSAAANARALGVSAGAVPPPGGTPDYFGSYPNYANSPLPNVTGVPAPATITLTGITVQNGGSGYSTPSVVLTGGGGTGATATARVSNGVITGIILTNAGTGYTSAPTVTISDPRPRAAGAAAVVAFTAGVPTVAITGGIRKFMDSLPGLGPTAANNLGQYIPIAVADTTTFLGSDYYEIELREYTEKMHTDLSPTRLRGYVQVRGGADVAPIHYLGPLIIAQRDRPVRVKFTNKLPVGAGGDLFIPVDTTYMGAGLGPDGVNSYKQNRGTLHLHGGNTPWISDGTPHQWITPVTETTPYPQGVSVHNVPDMPNPGAGSQTFFYTNQQSARLMFYHDHAYGITRLNVYAGEAAAYLLTDSFEAGLVAPAGPVPATQIPLVIQDKTFVDPATINAQDPTWNGPRTSGSLWYPHVYMPNQNPFDPTGANAMGRWDYGPWFWPPFTGIQFGAVPNPYYDPANAPWEPPQIPGVPDISGTPESFMDTPIVNGTVYPFVVLQPQAYRFRILNACNDRFVNLQLYQTSTIVGRIILTNPGSGYTTAPTVTITGGGGTSATARATIDPLTSTVTAITLVTTGTGYTTVPTVTISPPTTGTAATAIAEVYTGQTEIGMVPAVAGQWPQGWGTPDSRDGGWPDPTKRGPAMIQIGTEGGFLPGPALIKNVPVDFDYNRRSIVVLNVLEHSLFLAPAERADVIIDFSNFAGKTLILYNDSPAPVPGFDPRLDYYTGNPDNTSTGGVPSTLPGYGPNTRTVMQIRVAGTGGTAPPDDYNPATLSALATALPAAFAQSQDTIIVPQAPYNAVYNRTFPNTAGSAYVRIQDNSLTFQPVAAAGAGTVTGITVFSPGVGYTTPPTVSITGGGGTGATATATIVPAGRIASIVVVNPGSGYTTVPTVSITGGGGTGATATATLTNSPVTGITLTNQGSGYRTIPTVTISGGGGTGATATATISGGRVTTLTLVTPGSGYTRAPTVSITGGGGAGAAATATVAGTGRIATITVTNAGSGYTTVPTVAITGGGGTGATAIATITPGVVTGITVTNPGTGYTTIPLVTLTGGGGTGAVATATISSITLDFMPKSIIEDFTLDYGRMNAILGNEIPRANNVQQTSILQAYIDPPVEIYKVSDPATPIGSPTDGTQLWKITHNGVDTHVIHFHLFNVQIINRVGWDGAIRPPDPNELGWKEAVRMNPLEDIVVALRPLRITGLPFNVPNSIRLLDPTRPAGSTIGFTNVDPFGNPTTVTNDLTNFGWEYVYHCHILGHEENDMMRPTCAVVPLTAGNPPSNLNANRVGADVVLTWQNNGLSSLATGITVERATNQAFTTGLATFLATTPLGTPLPTTYTDVGAPAGALWYRVKASNIVGSVTAVGYPTMSADSAASNTAGV